MNPATRFNSGGGLAASVIVPTYNRVEMLRWTLSSLANQVFETPEFEVLVCDDGSSDGTEEMVREFSRTLNLGYFFQEDRGYRVASARNLGIRAAKGRICIFLDSGVIASRNFVLGHLRIHECFPGRSAVIGYVHGFDERDSAGHSLLDFLVPFNPDLTIEKVKASEGFGDMREIAYRDCANDLGSLPAPWSFFWTCNVSAPREDIERVGRFDEAFQSWGVEDVDLGYRLHRIGLHFRIGREAEALHCPHSRDIEGNLRSDKANKILFFKKHLDFATEALLFSSDFDFNPQIAEFFKLRCQTAVLPVDINQVAFLLNPGERPGKAVLIGTACFGRFESGSGLVCLEADSNLMAKRASENPGTTFLNLLGMATPFPDGAFEASIISLDWLHLREKWRAGLLSEQARISKVQFFLLEQSTLSGGQAISQLISWAQSTGKQILIRDSPSFRYAECRPSQGL